MLNELILNQEKTLTNGCIDNMFCLSLWPCVPSLIALCAKIDGLVCQSVCVVNGLVCHVALCALIYT